MDLVDFLFVCSRQSEVVANDTAIGVKKQVIAIIRVSQDDTRVGIATPGQLEKKRPGPLVKWGGAERVNGEQVLPQRWLISDQNSSQQPDQDHAAV